MGKESFGKGIRKLIKTIIQKEFSKEEYGEIIDITGSKPKEKIPIKSPCFLIDNIIEEIEHGMYMFDLIIIKDEYEPDLEDRLISCFPDITIDGVDIDFCFSNSLITGGAFHFEFYYNVNFEGDDYTGQIIEEVDVDSEEEEEDDDEYNSDALTRNKKSHNDVYVDKMFNYVYSNIQGEKVTPKELVEFRKQIKKEYKNSDFGRLSFKGKGNKIIKNIDINHANAFIAYAKQENGDYFSAKLYDETGNDFSVFDEAGAINRIRFCVNCLEGKKYFLQIETNGSWEIGLVSLSEFVKNPESENIKSEGNYLSQVLLLERAPYVFRIDYDGDDYFAVTLFNSNMDYTEIVYGDGDVHAEKIVTVPDEGFYLLYVESNGKWKVNVSLLDDDED